MPGNLYKRMDTVGKGKPDIAKYHMDTVKTRSMLTTILTSISPLTNASF